MQSYITRDVVLSNDKLNLTENIFCHISLWRKASYRRIREEGWEERDRQSKRTLYVT